MLHPLRLVPRCRVARRLTDQLPRFRGADRFNKDNDTMAIKAAATTRAPRGTKTLTQAFFDAADGIPVAQRGAVVKAALAAIRDQLKDDREKAKVAKDKAKVKAGKTASVGKPKIAGPATKKPPVSASKGKKAKAKPGRKVPTEAAPTATSETDAE